jgi:8-oxo-dGTP pyrophosphatase MutT (NUDIX family)
MAVRRFGARVVLLDPADRILLFRLQNPRSGNTWWATPGGGVDPGEKSLDAARRELREETGIEVEELVGPIWIDDHWFRTAEDLIHQQDRYFHARTKSPKVDVSGQDRFETDLMVEHRWWKLGDLDETTDRVYPAGLGRHVRELLKAGPPEKPIQLNPPKPKTG